MTHQLRTTGSSSEEQDADATAAMPEAAKLPDHVVRFLELSGALDREVRKEDMDPIAITRARETLRVFYVTLNHDQREEIRHVILDDAVGAAIEKERGTVFKGIVLALEVPHRIVGAAAEPIAKLCGKTVELIVQTLGWTIRGAVEGAVKVFRKAA